MRKPECIALALLAASLAWAAPGASPGKKYFDAAVKLFNAFEFERSLAQLEKARAHSDGVEMDVGIALYEGIVQLELGRDDQGAAAFRTALSLDPAATLPTRVSPKVQQLFDSLKSEMGGMKVPPPVDTAAPPPTPPPQLQGTSVRPPPARVTQSSAPRLWWVPAAAGAVFGIAGVVLLFQAKSRSDLLSGRAGQSFDLATAQRYESEGNAFQALGFTGLALTLAGVGVAAGLFFLGEKLGLASLGSPPSRAWAVLW